MIAADETLVVPVILILFDDAHEAFNIRFYLRFLFNFKDYVLNTNYSMGVKKYEDNDTDDQITKGIMLVDGKVVDKNSLVVVKKIEAV